MAALTHVQQGCRIIQGRSGSLIMNVLSGEVHDFDSVLYKGMRFNQQGWGGLVPVDAHNPLLWLKELFKVECFQGENEKLYMKMADG
eukprot:1192214-Lingulodinium_polyedra.AAC.1